MTLEELNRKIAALPRFTLGELNQSEAIVIRDTRLGILGCHQGDEPTADQIAIVDAELFPMPS